MFLKVDNVGAEPVCSGILFQATGPATEKNARGCRVVALFTPGSPTNESQQIFTAEKQIRDIFTTLRAGGVTRIFNLGGEHDKTCSQKQTYITGMYT